MPIEAALATDTMAKTRALAVVFMSGSGGCLLGE
jgi:hypothetical protein